MDVFFFIVRISFIRIPISYSHEATTLPEGHKKFYMVTMHHNIFHRDAAQQNKSKTQNTSAFIYFCHNAATYITFQYTT